MFRSGRVIGPLVLSCGLLTYSSVSVLACDNPNALGVSRTVEIDTTGGPGFGMEHYKAYDFLQDKEVVLTFDDGPQKYSTEAVLKALAEHCTKATFFSVGKMAVGYPHIIRSVKEAGHTVGTHTWSHRTIPKLKNFKTDGVAEIERGNSAVRRAVGGPVAPFFRFPTLRHSEESLHYLAKRNISMFSTDIDSFDFKLQPPKTLALSVLKKLERRGKGIVLMHDIHRNTAKALPYLLDALKENGFKIVHLTAKGEMETVPKFDKLVAESFAGVAEVGAGRPLTSVVKTVDGEKTPREKAAAAKKEDEKNKVREAEAVPAEAGGTVGPGPVKPQDGAMVDNAEPVGDIATESGSAAASPVSTKSAVTETASIKEGEAAAKAENLSSADDKDEPKSLSDKASAILDYWFGK